MSLKRLNVALVPPPKVSQNAIRISKYLATKFSVDFILNNKHYFPHITIYSTAYPQTSESSVIDQVKHIISYQKPVNLIFSHISISNNSPSVEFKFTPELKHQHRIYTNTLNPFRENQLRPKYHPTSYHFQSLTSKEQKIVKKYGYIEAGSLHHPHITLTHFKISPPPSISMQLAKLWQPSNCTVTKIGIFEMANFGTCTKLIKKFELT